MMWLKHNLNDRSWNSTPDFQIEFDIKPFKYLSFKDSCIDLAKSIANEHQRLYLSYSGGLDSEFVLKVFIEAGIPITPVAISTSFNQGELHWARKYCAAHGIKLTVIDIPDVEFLTKLYYKTNDKGLYAMLGAVPDIVHDYYGGIVLTGNPSPFDLYNPRILEFCEYEYYDFGGNIINFFAGNQQVFYSLLKEFDDKLTTQEAKAKLYGLEYRDKIRYSESFYMVTNQLRTFNLNYREEKDKDAFIKYFDTMLLPNG